MPFGRRQNASFSCSASILRCERLVISKTISVKTKERFQAIDITSQVSSVVKESGVSKGVAIIFTSHTTTGLFINEPESGLIKDIEKVLCDLVPPGNCYLHDRVDDNASSHIQSIILSTSLAVPISDGKLCLGRWQSVFLAERDGPRDRSLIVTIIGE